MPPPGKQREEDEGEMNEVERGGAKDNDNEERSASAEPLAGKLTPARVPLILMPAFLLLSVLVTRKVPVSGLPPAYSGSVERAKRPL